VSIDQIVGGVDNGFVPVNPLDIGTAPGQVAGILHVNFQVPKWPPGGTDPQTSSTSDYDFIELNIRNSKTLGAM
jgi:hypothetical protein